MNDLPPKSLKNQLVHLDRNLKDIERSQFAGIQRAPDSLPVLEAFQGFLEKERRIARRRMMTVVAIGVFMVLLIIGAGAAFIYMQMKNISVDYTALSAQANNLESELKTENRATHTQLATLEAYLSNNTEKHTQLLTAHSNVATQATQDHEQLASMRQSLENLAIENKTLKTQINNIVKDWQSIKQKSKPSIQKPEPEGQAQPQQASNPQAQKVELRSPRATAKQSDDRSKPDEPQASMTRPPAPSTQNPVPLSSSINLTIVPPGQKHGIRWRLPLISR